MVARFGMVWTLLVLGGCASVSDLDPGLNSLVGQDLGKAVDALGLPDDEQTIAGRRIVTWRTTYKGTTTNAKLKRMPGDGPPVAIPYENSCTIRASVSDKNVIEKWETAGHSGVCQKYVERLKAAAG